MFVVGMGACARVYFIFVTVIISVPTRVKVLRWVKIIRGGSIRFRVVIF